MSVPSVQQKQIKKATHSTKSVEKPDQLVEEYAAEHTAYCVYAGYLNAQA
jgi:hypothetical protein|tara:strand:+ start:133 stop:282 length:150 start_codon:yes stop_codon:yes gene_type:complete